MLTNDDIPFLTVIGERPDDKVAWQHYVQWLAERGEIDTSVYLYRDSGIIWRHLRLDWARIQEVRHQAREVGEYALQIIDYLLPIIRWPGSKAHAVGDVLGPPSLPVARFVEE